jgi:hypothetical protein
MQAIPLHTIALKPEGGITVAATVERDVAILVT